MKQEQNPSPCQVASQSTGTNLAANFEIVPSPTERICNVVRITTTTTTVNPTVCGIVTKVDKAENTIINMADCAKYSAKDGRSLVTATEHDTRVDEEVCKNDKVTPICSRGSRLGARIIEITEENCDSFHENLEFFARRKDISVDQHDRRDDSKDEQKSLQEFNTHEKEVSFRLFQIIILYMIFHPVSRFILDTFWYISRAVLLFRSNRKSSMLRRMLKFTVKHAPKYRSHRSSMRQSQM